MTMRAASLAALVICASAATSRAQAPPPTSGAPAPVRHFTKEQVDAGYEKRVLVLDEGHNGHYMVETAQRDKPGIAEMHKRDTDIVYVVKGSATMLTGGTIADVNPNPPVRPGNRNAGDEVRGARIVGGESRRLRVGDVIVIPEGVPHQFTEIEAPFWYFVVKSK